MKDGEKIWLGELMKDTILKYCYHLSVLPVSFFIPGTGQKYISHFLASLWDFRISALGRKTDLWLFPVLIHSAVRPDWYHSVFLSSPKENKQTGKAEWENLFLPIISWLFDCSLEVPSVDLCSFSEKFFCKPKEISDQNIFEVCSVLQMSFLFDKSWFFEMTKCFKKFPANSVNLFPEGKQKHSSQNYCKICLFVFVSKLSWLKRL